MAVNSIAGAIKWTGLASDTDFGKVVQQLVAIERRTINRQETWKSEWLKKLTAINGLDSRLSAIKLDARSYDTREKLLTRSANSSDEKVVTLSNLSTAPTGVYEVEVGAKIQEKVGSGSYKAGEAIGCSIRRDANGALLGADGQPVLLPWVKEGDDEGDYYVLGQNGYPADQSGRIMTEFLCYMDDDGYLVDQDNKRVFDPNQTYDKFNDEGYPLDDDDEIIYTPIPDGAGPPPLTITMGGKTLALKFDPRAKPGDAGVYNHTFTMQQLADTINATVEAEGYTGPKISAAVIFDKTRSGETYSRLVITGGEGGSANHITVSDPTNLGLNRKHFDDPVTTSLVGTSALPKKTADSAYTGHSNKTITFVALNSGELGEKDINISWADTEGNRGSFTLRAEDWDPVNKEMKGDIEVIQGLKLNFEPGANANFIANEAFTIDCQVPVLQQAADSGLAVSDKWIHRGWADMTSPVTFGSSGRFDFSYAGFKYSVPVADGLGLSGLADAINNFAQNPGVMATIINDGMGTATSYKLVLTGAHTGVEHGIEILSSTTLNRLIPSGDVEHAFEHARYAANSMSRFDGYPNDGVTWLQRPTNEVGDVIAGTVVNLAGVGKAVISIRNNVSDMANKIKSLVESVNLTKAFIKQNTKWGGGKLVSNVLSDGTIQRGTDGGEESGIMIGNYGFQISLSELDRLMTRAIFSVDDYIEARFPEPSTRTGLRPAEKRELYEEYLKNNGLLYTRLSDIGIRSDQSNGGVYVIEESRLMECLSQNPEAVIKLFTFTNGDRDFPAGNSVFVFEDEDDRPRLSGFAVQLGYRMADLTRPNDVVDPGTGKVVRPAKGITKVLAENYNNIISGSDGNGGIDAKIAREEKRIQLYQQRLEQKFARLEKALAQLNGLSETVSSQLAQLNNSSK